MRVRVRLVVDQVDAEIETRGQLLSPDILHELTNRVAELVLTQRTAELIIEEMDADEAG